MVPANFTASVAIVRTIIGQKEQVHAFEIKDG
jgi:hypothetical protein